MSQIEIKCEKKAENREVEKRVNTSDERESEVCISPQARCMLILEVGYI